MNRFQKPDLKNRIFKSVNYSILLFIAVICLFLYGIYFISNNSTTDDREILERALNRDIIHCYSVEGMYPPSLSYIENHYGLTYDHEKYIVDYEPVGGNIMPGVMIIERSSQ